MNVRYWSEAISTYMDTTRLVESGAIRAILQAIEHGIPEIVVDVLEANPDVILANKKLSREVFVTVIKYRREDILRIIYRLDVGKKAFHSLKEDEDGNNLLHLVAKFPQLPRDNRVGSVAWEFNRQIKWFKEFGSVLGGWYKGTKNCKGETPVQIFYKEHWESRNEAEEWAKKSAESFSVVAALLVTITFAAAFTLPGGNNQDTGIPMFLRKETFFWYMTLDAVSLFSGTTSLLAFIKVLTSSYRQKPFSQILLLELMTGALALFISVISMSFAFFLVVVLMLNENWWILTGIVSYLIMVLCSVAFIWFLPMFLTLRRMMSESRILE